MTPRQGPAPIATESASGFDPDRVLVLGDGLFPSGTGPAVRARVVADGIAARTGRGVDATAVPWSPSVSSRPVAEDGLDWSTYDVVLLAVPEAAVRGRAASGVVRELTGTIDAVRDRVHPAAVFVVVIAGAADRAFLAAAVQASGPRVVALVGDPDDPRAQALDAVHGVLSDQRESVRGPQVHRAGPQPDQHRYQALERLGILDTPAEDRFDRIVDAMGQLFRTSGAAINFLPADRQWTKSGTGNVGGDMALEDSFCKTTVTGSGPLVVGDAWDHAGIFPRNEIRFYAGHPIETLDGVRVGAVCVFDTAPRDVRSVEVDLLRDFAVMVRGELYR